MLLTMISLIAAIHLVQSNRKYIVLFLFENVGGTIDFDLKKCTCLYLEQ